MKPFTSEFLAVRGYRTHVRHWGRLDAPKLLMFHGWGDMSATWQFVVDELKRDWHVIAPDWRGCGQSDFADSTYYFPDFLADIDVILDHYSPDAAAPVVGHSMGGNAVGLYAGVRPERISHFVNLEGIGLWRTSPEDAPDRYGKWLRQLNKNMPFRTYPDRASMAARLRNDNPRLTSERADFLAQHFGVENVEGGIGLALDSAHRLFNPVLYRIEETIACWKRITAPVLWVTARDSHVFREFFPYDSDEHRLRIASFQKIKTVHLEDSGHNMQHDQPATIAALIEDFIA